jgi:hypothetical protein
LSGQETVARPFGGGPLSRVAALVYTLLVVEALVLVTAGPGLVLLTLLARESSNVPLAAACLAPAGPALSAAIYALRHRTSDLTDLHPATAFWRGYRLNAAGVLKVWVPWLVWMAVIGTSLANFGASGLPGWWVVLLVAVGVASTLWVANAVVITSLFTFRAVDVARLAAYSLGRFRGATLGTACLLVAAAGATLVASELVPVLLAPVLVLALLRYSHPMLTEIQGRFTR